MKCRLTRDQVIRNPAYQGPNPKHVAARHQLVARYADPRHKQPLTRAELRAQLKTVAAAGTIIEHPQAYQLVRAGVAEPVDDECRLRSDFTDAQITAAQLASEAIESGQGLPPELDTHNATDEEAAAFRRKATRKAS